MQDIQPCHEGTLRSLAELLPLELPFPFELPVVSVAEEAETDVEADEEPRAVPVEVVVL